jgi:hypothetical protein
MEVLSPRMVFLNECDRENGKPPRFNCHEACKGIGCDKCEERGWMFSPKPSLLRLMQW